MKNFYRFIFVVILGIFFGSYVQTDVQADTREQPKITNINTNYPIQNGTISLPNDATELDIHVDSQNAKMIRFYSLTSESDTRELISEDSDPTGGSDYQMDFNSSDGFSNKIVIEAVSEDGTIAKKTFKVDKGIEMETDDIQIG